MRLMLVGALVTPHLDYPAPLLTDLTKEQTLALQRLQNACIRYIYGTIPRTAHVTPYRLALGWLSAEGRREVINCSLASRIIRDASPGYLRSGFRVIGVPTETVEIRQSARRRPPVLYYKAPRTAGQHFLYHCDCFEYVCASAHECPSCSSTVKVQKLRPCEHKLCFECIQVLYKRECPFCQRYIMSYTALQQKLLYARRTARSRKKTAPGISNSFFSETSKRTRMTLDLANEKA
ncbi:unnamed protein product, partial [Trichogramma brassicae]